MESKKYKNEPMERKKELSTMWFWKIIFTRFLFFKYAENVYLYDECFASVQSSDLDLMLLTIGEIDSNVWCVDLVSFKPNIKGNPHSTWKINNKQTNFGI